MANAGAADERRIAIPAAGSRDRGGVWALPFARHEQTMLLSQAKYDRRNIPLLWLWRFLGVEEANGSALEEATSESIPEHRRYAAPVAAHLYVDWTPEAKAKKKGLTETTGVAPVAVSRAEARRLGVLFDLRVDAEGLVGDSARRDPLYVPQPGDVFRTRDRFYEVIQMKPEWLAATQIVSRWGGTAAMSRNAASLKLSAPPSYLPPEPAGAPQ